MARHLVEGKENIAVEQFSDPVCRICTPFRSDQQVHLHSHVQAIPELQMVGPVAVQTQPSTQV